MSTRVTVLGEIPATDFPVQKLPRVRLRRLFSISSIMYIVLCMLFAANAWAFKYVLIAVQAASSMSSPSGPPEKSGLEVTLEIVVSVFVAVFLLLLGIIARHIGGKMNEVKVAIETTNQSFTEKTEEILRRVDNIESKYNKRYMRIVKALYRLANLEEGQTRTDASKIVGELLISDELPSASD